jgi:hypothetical protein
MIAVKNEQKIQHKNVAVDEIVVWDEIVLGRNCCFIVLVDEISAFITSGRGLRGRNILTSFF